MQRLPLHPRLARVLIAARGSFEGCAACAWLSEPASAFAKASADRLVSTTSDLLPIIDQWNRMPPHLRQVAQNLQRIARPLVGDAYRDRIDETELRRALLAGTRIASPSGAAGRRRRRWRRMTSR